MTLSSEYDAQPVGLFWRLRLDEALPPAVKPGVAATFLRAGRQDIPELATAMGFDDSIPVERRFELGRHCYLARVEGHLVSYGWITFDQERIGELGLRVRLLPDEAYIWDCATLVDFRGQHLYPALLSYMLRQLRTSGIRRVWIGMDADNLPSQAGVARAGFKLIVTLLQARHASTRTFFMRNNPDASQEDIQDAHYALFGDKAANLLVSPEKTSGQ
jgi:ribosomal protein S18 acetylase RimI-like enzyme